jgi:iron complex transport system substrate-binding protein
MDRWWLPILAAVILSGAVVLVRVLQPLPARPLPTVQSQAPEKPIPGSGRTPLDVVAEDATTRTIRHVQGVSVIPRHPQRVAVLGWNDEVAALGVVPVAASGDGRRGFVAHLQPYLQGTRLIDASGGGPDLEALAAAKPDLIITSWSWQTSNDAITRIAPTIVLQPAHWEWHERVRDLGLVLDRQREADERLAALDAKIAEARTAIAARIGTQSVALLRVWAREYRLYGHGFSGPLLYLDLGLQPPALVRDLAWQRDVVQLSIEGLVDLDADHLLLMTEETLPVSFQVQDRLTTHPLWRRLKAVRAGHVHTVPNELMRGGVIARELMVERMRALLAP